MRTFWKGKIALRILHSFILIEFLKKNRIKSVEKGRRLNSFSNEETSISMFPRSLSPQISAFLCSWITRWYDPWMIPPVICFFLYVSPFGLPAFGAIPMQNAHNKICITRSRRYLQCHLECFCYDVHIDTVHNRPIISLISKQKIPLTVVILKVNLKPINTYVRVESEEMHV